MRVDVYPTVLNIPPAADLAGRAAVVIDVLRATTTICTALEHGAEAVVPLLSPDEAFRMVAENPERAFVLGGERRAVPIPGFHLGNSPLEYTGERVQGRTILFTTTNGTRAISRAAGAGRVLIACLRNAPAVAGALARMGRDVAVCCAGTHDQFSLEDTACAGAILESLAGSGMSVETNDLGVVAQSLFREYDGRLGDLLRRSEHGQRLARLGRDEDLRFCAEVGTSGSVPVFTGERVVLRLAT